MEEEKTTKIPLEAKFTLTHTLTLEAVSNILANGLWRGYSAFDDIDFDDAQYGSAHARLLEDGRDAIKLSIEDVEACMLMMGYPLRLHEVDEPSDEGWHELTIAKLVERGLPMYDANPFNGTLMDVLNCDENGNLDANDYDRILQYAVFGEVLIG